MTARASRWPLAPFPRWRALLKRSWRELREDDLTLLAAALTYYGVVALIPALLLLASVLGLFGTPAIQPLLANLEGLTPGPARDILRDALQSVQRAGGRAGFGLVIALLGALWSASGYVSCFTKASNAIYDVEERRPFWKLRPLQIAVTVVLVLLTALLAVAIVVSGPLAREAGELLGIGDTALAIWSVARWPLLALVVSQLIAFLYWVSPNVSQPGYRWVSPGSLLAVAVWVGASALFAGYVSRSGGYGAAYGRLAGVLVFLVWLWIGNLAVLLGAELNALLEQEHEDAARACPRPT